MPSTCWFASLFAATLTVGCSSSSTDHPSPRLDPGPHRGALRAISDKSGFIEVVTEPIRDAPSGTPKFRVAIYFLDRDQTSALKPMPTDVAMTASWSDAPAPKTFDLTIDPVAGDPAGAAKFVAPPVDHKGAPTGTISAKLADRAVSATL